MSTSWKNLSLVILVLLAILRPTLASENYSVEEQDPAEQTADVDDKDYGDDKPPYELQMAIWSGAEHHVNHEPNAPVFEEQEIAYPPLTQQEDNEGEVTNNNPSWHHSETTTTTTTTERPPIYHQTGWWLQPTTKTPVHVQTTWQQVPTTKKPISPQTVPVWHHATNNVKPSQAEVVNIPAWLPSSSNVPSNPVQVPAQVSVPAPSLVPAPPQQPVPQNEIPVGIFPDIHFDEAEAIADQQDGDDFPNDHSNVDHVQHYPSLSKPTQRPKPQVEVIEQYQIVNPNGTTEYKLVLSNGMTNYKKIYNKLLPNGKIVTVQEGYDSVPIPGDDPYTNNFQTQYYIADEFGHNVYRVEKHTLQPQLPSHLDYKEQNVQL